MTGTDRIVKRTDYVYNLGNFGRPITTNSTQTQIWFNRGLTWAYTFNHKEAATCFEQAITHDDSCAMAYWGLAYALGPNYNHPWEFFGHNLEDVARRTYNAVQKAKALAPTATPVEQALIAAIQARFQGDKPATMEQYRAHNRAYADAMEVAYREFDDDLDIMTLYADSMMSLSAWVYIHVPLEQTFSISGTCEVSVRQKQDDLTGTSATATATFNCGSIILASSVRPNRTKHS